MIRFDYEVFCNWFAAQRNGTNIMDMLDRDQCHYLHDICNAFKDEVELEQARMAREAATRREMDAMRAEMSEKYLLQHQGKITCE